MSVARDRAKAAAKIDAIDATPEPRRLTPTERLHTALMAMIERAPSAAAKPAFDVQRTKAGAEQAKATGVFEFVEWSVHVPVCDEYPTADEAHAATLRYAQAYAEAFPAAVNGPADTKPKPAKRTRKPAEGALADDEDLPF